VDAGEYRQDTLELREFGQSPRPIDYLILVGLHEADNGPEYLGHSAQDWGKSRVYRVGKTIVEGVGAGGKFFETQPASREQLVAQAKAVMLMELVKTSFGDELLGLEELRITQTDMQKAKQLNGAPIMKQLVFKGDDSIYVVDVRFRLKK